MLFYSIQIVKIKKTKKYSYNCWLDFFSYYAIKTDEAWFYSISWIPVTDPVNETDCYLSDKQNAEVKLSSLAFKKDFNRENRETKTGFVYFDEIQNSNSF